MEVKPERTFTVDLERNKQLLQMLCLEYVPHRTVLHRTLKRLEEEYMEQLNKKTLGRQRKLAQKLQA